MGNWKRLSIQTAPKVFKRILEMPKEDLKILLEEFGKTLDDLRDQDFFGTEGQTDPRGDPRP